jgi:methyl coenzyme M reductase subunit C
MTVLASRITVIHCFASIRLGRAGSLAARFTESPTIRAMVRRYATGRGAVQLSSPD